MSQSTGSPGAVKRRDFLKVLGATGAATAVVGCSQEHVDRLIPYVQSPDHTVPGVSTYYASTCRECAAGCGVIAEVRDGRAIKLEGNVDHPLNKGALCARGQSALQGLYNPDRFRSPMIRQNGTLIPTTWEVAIAAFTEQITRLRSGGQSGNALFINQHEGGSFPAFLDQWLAAYGIPPHLAWDAEADLATMSANRQSYGVAWPSFDFSATRLIVSFGGDFLETWGASVPQQLAFADARAKLVEAPRFIYIGPRRSLTGLSADTWYACTPGSELAIANAILGALGGGGGTTVAQAAEASGLAVESIEALVREVAAARPSLVMAGANTNEAEQLALAVNAINEAAGNVGVTVLPDRPFTALDGAVGADVLAAAIQRMGAGEVPLVMVRGANPVFTLPKSLNVAEAFARAGYRISFSSVPDETTMLCDLVMPMHHALESWGDSQPLPGTIALQQPVMERVFDTRDTGDLLIRVALDDPSRVLTYPAATYREWLAARFPGGERAMTAALPNALANGNIAARAAQFERPATVTMASALASQSGEFYLVAYPSPLLGDGRGGNKPWLQELADPVSKISWQSWVEMHPLTARRLDVRQGDHVSVQTTAGTITAPVWTYLGVRQDTVAVALGRGHTAYGRYAEGVGINALDALAGAVNSAGGLVLTQLRATVTKAGEHSDLVTTEGSARQHGRELAQAVLASALADTVTVEEEEHTFPGAASTDFLPGLRSPVAADAQGELADSTAKSLGMYDPDHWSQMARRRWAMTIDLARCTGCSACVTACYAENNIPTVGARWQGRALRPGTPVTDAVWDTRPGANILKGREMTWIRLERYFEGGEDGVDEFDVRFLPMLCQHCGNAPCESVCPVYATYHSPDGLNVQVYNRCVGTRYCSNGCPYKVRYFNWFGYGEIRRRQYAFPEPLNWQLNPDVTVRGKGVMEKCTFCVQRIREAEHRAALEDRTLRPDEFTTACAQACPSRAIIFGDAADEEWSVASLVENQRAYHVFKELNTFTAVVYLKKVSHPSIAPAQVQPSGGPR